jgi:zinc transporter ZupT
MGGKLSSFGAIAALLANANNSQRQAMALPQPSPWAVVQDEVTKSAAPEVSAMTALKPFFLIACVAFVAGFMGYVALTRITAPDLSVAAAPQESWSSTASTPAPSSGDWNAGKQI